MNPYLLDSLDLLLCWAHINTGVARIGWSFHRVSLDRGPTPPKNAAKGVGGTQWGVNGSGPDPRQNDPNSQTERARIGRWFEAGTSTK